MTTIPRIDRDICCICGGCVGACPTGALFLTDTELRLDPSLCVLCGACAAFCPVRALSMTPETASKPAGETIVTDVVVVGAGPAGSVCAESLARSGIGVVVLEKRQEIGAPKRCAEGISSQTLEILDIKPDPRWIARRMRSAVLYAPDGTAVRWKSRSRKDWGYILERKVFDKHLARNAVVAGARYLVKTAAVGIVKENGIVTGVETLAEGVHRTIRARIVIAADGPDSLVAKWAGIASVNDPEHYISGFQYEMAGLRNIDESAVHLFLGSRIAPGGYVWIFPKGQSLANVGVGIKAGRSRGRSARDCLDAFIRSRPEIFSGASPLEINCGGVPTKRSIPALVGDGLMVIGDAGHLVNPATGGGIKLAMMSGRLAAEVAAAAIRKNSVSHDFLKRYPKLWESRQGRRMARMQKLNRLHDALSDEDLNRLAGTVSSGILDDLYRGKHSSLVKILIQASPELARIAARYLKA